MRKSGEALDLLRSLMEQEGEMKPVTDAMVKACCDKCKAALEADPNADTGVIMQACADENNCDVGELKAACDKMMQNGEDDEEEDDDEEEMGEALIDDLEKFAGPLKPGRNTIKGYPVDVQDNSNTDGTSIDMTAVDADAATGLLKELRKAGFKAERSGKNGVTVMSKAKSITPALVKQCAAAYKEALSADSEADLQSVVQDFAKANGVDADALYEAVAKIVKESLREQTASQVRDFADMLITFASKFKSETSLHNKSKLKVWLDDAFADTDFSTKETGIAAEVLGVIVDALSAETEMPDEEPTQDEIEAGLTSDLRKIWKRAKEIDDRAYLLPHYSGRGMMGKYSSLAFSSNERPKEMDELDLSYDSFGRGYVYYTKD